MAGRRRRTRSGAGRKAEGEGADALMECEKNPDYVERLARKYMRKCRVESSTDSESDNTENFGNNLSSTPTHEITSKNVELLKLQFRDPYDGDSEETSAQSDSSTQDPFLSETDSTISSAKAGHVRMECSSGSVQDQQTIWDDCSLASCEIRDIAFRPQAAADSVPENVKSWQRTASATSQSRLSVDSDIVAEAAKLSGHLVLIGVNPRVASSASSVFAASLTSEENSDFSMVESSVMKRKFGLKMDSEKLRRKKARMAEHMVRFLISTKVRTSYSVNLMLQEIVSLRARHRRRPEQHYLRFHGF